MSIKLADIKSIYVINKLGVSDDNINYYTFEYKDKSNGSGLYQGVIANELLDNEAVGTYASGKNKGYYKVDYSKIDVEFKSL